MEKRALGERANAREQDNLAREIFHPRWNCVLIFFFFTLCGKSTWVYAWIAVCFHFGLFQFGLWLSSRLFLVFLKFWRAWNTARENSKTRELSDKCRFYLELIRGLRSTFAIILQSKTYRFYFADEKQSSYIRAWEWRNVNRRRELPTYLMGKYFLLQVRASTCVSTYRHTFLTAWISLGDSSETKVIELSNTLQNALRFM